MKEETGLQAMWMSCVDYCMQIAPNCPTLRLTSFNTVKSITDGKHARQAVYTDIPLQMLRIHVPEKYRG